MSVNDVLLEVFLKVHSGLLLLFGKFLDTAEIKRHSVFYVFCLDLETGILLDSRQFLDSDLDACVHVYFILGCLDADQG